MDERIEVLETAELEGGPEGVGVDGYTQLLSLYLATGQIYHSKYLWKRIPQTMKTASEELIAVWNVGQTLWLKDTRSFHNTVKAFQWSETIAPIMSRVADNVREATIRLIGGVYTCIRTKDAAELLGIAEADLPPIATPLKWNIQNGLVYPVEPLSPEAHTMSADDQIAKLTDYVTVLEN